MLQGEHSTFLGSADKLLPEIFKYLLWDNYELCDILFKQYIIWLQWQA